MEKRVVSYSDFLRKAFADKPELTLAEANELWRAESNPGAIQPGLFYQIRAIIRENQQTHSGFITRTSAVAVAEVQNESLLDNLIGQYRDTDQTVSELLLQARRRISKRIFEAETK